MSKPIKTTLVTLGILLLINGFGNIVDDARVLTYDITSVLSGLGFLVISRIKPAA